MDKLVRTSVTLLALALLVVPLRGGRSALTLAHAQQASGQQQQQERPSNAGVHCFETAQRVLFLVDQTAYNLCLGAGSDAPLQCFAAARATTPLTDPQIVALCRCAMSTGPVQCYLEARRQAFLLDDQLTAMCSATITQQVYGGACLAPRY
jgi:hypothetical protein